MVEIHHRPHTMCCLLDVPVIWGFRLMDPRHRQFPSAVKNRERSGPHHIALAMWVSGGEMTLALGTLPPHIRTGVLTAFRAVYQSEKCGGSLYYFPRDVSTIELSGDDALPGYRPRFSTRVILRATVVLFRKAKGTIIHSSEYVDFRFRHG